VEAIDRATLSSGLSSKVTSVGFRRGQKFQKDDVLIEFSCQQERARSNGARAAYNASKKNYEKNKELLSYDATGKFDVEIAKATMEQALAEYSEQRAVANMCKIIAPYNGSVVSTFINTHETPQPSQPLIEIVNTKLMEVNLIIPSSFIEKLKIGDDFPFELDDIKNIETARIDRIGAIVDPISQTTEVIAVIENPSPKLRPGMGGEGKFTFRIGG